MAKETILIVEDEPDILELIRFNLEREGYRTVTCETGEDALEAVARRKPDLILLDLMLPGVDGKGVCRALKGDAETRDVPVIMVTARGEEADIVTGLELGADDYVSKPFSPKILMARVGAVLRRVAAVGPRHQDAEQGVIEVLDMVIHPGRRLVSIAGETVDVPAPSSTSCASSPQSPAGSSRAGRS